MNLPFINKEILSLDLGSYETKVVQGKNTKNGIIVDDYFSIPTPEGAYMDGQILDEDLIYYGLNEELKNRKIKNKNVYLTINGSSIIIREVIIPKVAEEEIGNILQFQIEEYIPINSEDYIVQFKTIGTVYEENIEKLNILLIAIPKGIIESHLQLIKKLNLNPLVLDYQPNSIAKLLAYNSYINTKYPIENITFAIVDLGYSSTKVSIVKEDTIMVSRIIDIGMKYIDQNILNFFNFNKLELEKEKRAIKNIDRLGDEEEQDKLANIIRRSIENLNEKIEIIFRYYLTRSGDNKINMILLYGGGSNIEGISNLFSNYFGIPTMVINTLDNVICDGEIYKYMNSIGGIIRTTEV